MTAELTVFDFRDEPVRTVTVDGEPWFVGADVCRCLGIVNTRDAISRLSDDERMEINLNTVGSADGIRPGNPNATAINEPGLYRLIFESRKAEAEVFKRWVLHDVLPTLRKTGRYDIAGVDWEAMHARLAMIRETRLTHGKKAARVLWRRLGLPHVDDDHPEPKGSGVTDYVADFLSEMTEKDGDAKVTSKAMHEAYRTWARTTGSPIVMPSAFGRCLARLGISRVKSNGYPVYPGLRIKTLP